MPCCDRGQALKEEYENALKFEALSYGRLIAHKRRHEEVGKISRVRNLQMVVEAARRYREGDVEALGEIPPKLEDFVGPL